MTDEIKKKILEHYQKGQGSIQDLARIYKVEVDEVLQITGNEEMSSVTFVGDLIDASEMNGTGQLPNTAGSTYKVKYTKD